MLRALDYFRRRARTRIAMAEAVAVVRSKRQPDGRSPLDRIHPGHVHFDLEGGVGAPSRWDTLRAFRVLEWWDGRATTLRQNCPIFAGDPCQAAPPPNQGCVSV